MFLEQTIWFAGSGMEKGDILHGGPLYFSIPESRAVKDSAS